MQDSLNYLENTNIFLLIFQISFLSLIIYLVITDDRFLLNRKFIFIIIIILLIIISLYIEKMPYLIIKDLFWYSLVINGSFIFHVLILDRIFHWCWKNHYEYLGFVVSRISFTLSLSGIMYIIYNLIKFIRNIFYYDILSNIIWKGNLNVIKLTRRKRKLINIITVFKIIIIYFINVFHNYSLVLQGRNDKINDIKLITKLVIKFIIFFTISWIIGIPRLYIIWIFQFILESYKIINREYEKDKMEDKTIYNKISYWVKKHYTDRNNILLYNCFCYKYEELEKIYEKSYHTFFMFDLYKFIYNPYLGVINWIWVDTDVEHNKYNWPYPVLELYKFYPWEKLAIGYSLANILFTQEDIDTDNIRWELDNSDKKEIIEQSIKWSLLINKDQEYLLGEIKKETKLK